ncbi:hypothetical protein QQ045_018263 [Rhodiola kirilowii]
MWLRVLSNKDVQNIEIDAYEYEEKFYPIPSCLFHCRELKELSLCNCKHTHPSDFKGFANLTSLSLKSVDIAPSILEILISRCPLLETLSLNNSSFENPLALKALNLKTFYFEDYWFKNIIFKDVPKLTCLSLLATCVTEKIERPQLYNMLDLFCSLSKIEELTYDLRLLEDVLFTLCLIRSAPNLRNMTIHLDPESEYGYESEETIGEAAELLESEAKTYESYNSLQTIKIGVTAVSRHEILLINILQRCCPKLKSIVIKK